MTLWDADVDPLENYHVHGLAVLPDDTVLAATEGRYETCDAGPRDILLRRSTDGARSFGPTQTVIRSVDGQSWGNPTLLVDRTTGTVFLFYALSLRLPENTSCSGDIGKLFVVHSTDKGITWSEPTALSQLFADFPYDWALDSPGPGHGIQLHSGRLLLNIAHRRVIVGNTVTERYYGISTIYSDDHGKSWRAGGAVPVSTDYPGNEARLVERSDGSVLVNARAAAGGNRNRIVSISRDGGLTWCDPKLDGSTGMFNAVDAGMIRYTGGPGRHHELSRILFSRPDAPVRRNMTVSVSYDEGTSLWFSRVITTERSYYSDLARLSDGTIVLLYGCDGDIPSAPLRVKLARFNLEWLTGSRDSLHRPVGYAERVVHFATAHRVRGSLRPTRVADPIARSGMRVELATTRAGDHLAYQITSPPGHYHLQLRYYRPSEGAAFEVRLDGRPLPVATTFDSQDGRAEGYQPAYLGRVRLRGRHIVTIDAIGPGRQGGTTLSLDSLAIIRCDEPDVRNEVVVDNDQPIGCTVVSGTWKKSRSGTQGAWTSTYLSHAPGSGDAVVRWWPVVPVDGHYRIEASVLSFGNRSAAAPYVVSHDGQNETVTLNQQVGGTWDPRGAAWLPLGEFDLHSGLGTTVSLSDAPVGYVAADAIRLIRVDAP